MTAARRTLGIVAVGPRNIRPGTEYEQYFKPAHGQEKYLSYAGTNYDTLNFMANIVRETLGQTKAIAQKLKGKDLNATCKNIFDFIFSHYQYKQDHASKEQLRSPYRAWKDRRSGVDCDCYTITASSMLTNLGISHAFKMTKYDGKDFFQHVYVVVPKHQKGNTTQHFTEKDLQNRSNYFVIDPVLNQYDTEKTPSEAFHKIFNMSKGLHGVGLSNPAESALAENLLGLDGRKERKAARKTRKAARKQARAIRKSTRQQKQVIRKQIRKAPKSQKKELKAKLKATRKAKRATVKDLRKTGRQQAKLVKKGKTTAAAAKKAIMTKAAAVKKVIAAKATPSSQKVAAKPVQPATATKPAISTAQLKANQAAIAKQAATNKKLMLDLSQIKKVNQQQSKAIARNTAELNKILAAKRAAQMARLKKQQQQKSGVHTYAPKQARITPLAVTRNIKVS